MSWSRRHLLTGACAALALSACGFTPVHGPGGSPLFGQIAVDPPRDRAGWDLVKALKSRLGDADTPRYRLSADLTLQRETAAVSGAQEITRYQVVGGATYTLTEIDSGTVVTSGTVTRFAGFDATGTTLAVRSARLDAQTRVMQMLADDIVTRLMAQLTR